MSKVSIIVNVQDLERSFTVQVPLKVTGKKLHQALLKRVKVQESATVSYQLFQKRVSKKIYPDCADMTLQQLGIINGDTILMKPDFEGGASKRG